MTDSDTNAAPLIVRLFGPMQVLVGGQPLTPMRSRKSLWLLALLALRPQRAVEREWLTGLLWPDLDQQHAFANLRPILSELRNGLGHEKERLQSPDRHTLRLDLDGADVDVSTFDAAIAKNNRAGWERAAGLYLGPLLEGCGEEWVFQERTQREQQCLQSLQSLGDLTLAAGDYASAATWFQRAVALDCWSDAARQGLMQALAQSGDRNAALQTYREYAELLRSDPGAMPDVETSALYARLRAEARQQAKAPSQAQTPTPAQTPRPAKPQLMAPSNAAPASVPLPPPVSGSLPHPLTELVGRHNERAEVAARLRRSRLVTLTGLGGIGKTRLALEVAAESGQDYADGVWLVALETLAENSQVVRQIAQSLHLREEAGRPLLQSVTACLRTKRLLLVLDNCEHLLEGSAQTVEHLLRECKGVRILATSREPLGLTGETVWVTPPMDSPLLPHLPPEPADLPPALMRYASVELFVERAQAAQQSFALTPDNALAVARICARLERIPLAIELAAARVSAMTVEQVAARLHREWKPAAGGRRGAASRQQTLRATLDWSNALLSAPERSLLCRLSVFVGGWSLEAAEAVCDGAGISSWHILDLLSSLVEKSLVVFSGRENGGRYRLLEIVRQYAAEGLQAGGQESAVRLRHRHWFAALAESSVNGLRGAEQGAWLARLETEHENLRAALAVCRMDTSGATVALQMAGALWRFWEIHGYYTEGRANLSESLERDTSGDPTPERARALNGAGVLAYYQGDLDSATTLHEASADISRELGDKVGLAWPLFHLGNIALRQSRYEAARVRHEEALALWRELENKRGIGLSLHELGSVLREQGKRDSALKLYEECLAISRELDDAQGIAWALNDLGQIARDQGDYEAAKARHEESLAISRALGDAQGTAWSLHHLGDVAGGQNDYVTAQSLDAQSLEIFHRLQNKQGIAWTKTHMGYMAEKQGDNHAAESLFLESLHLQRELGNRLGEAWSLIRLGAVAETRQRHAAAKAYYEEALAIYEEIGYRKGIADSMESLALLLLAKNNPATNKP